MVTMFGWLSLPADWASRRKRWLSWGSIDTSPVIILMATWRLRTGSWARKTCPIAPWPIRLRIVYLPTRAGCSGFWVGAASFDIVSESTMLARGPQAACEAAYDERQGWASS